MKFDSGPDTVVYERLPPGSTRPAIEPPYMDANSAEVGALFVHYTKLCFVHYTNLYIDSDVEIGRVPICWVRFLQATTSGSPPIRDVPDPIVFCHERISAGGHRRLVTAAFPGNRYPGDALDEAVCTRVYGPAGANPYAELSQSYAGMYDIEPPLPMPRRVFAGQVDPQDASRFSIEYEWPDGVRGFIDGQLLDDDTVKTFVRRGPGDIASTRIRIGGELPPQQMQVIQKNS